jgi:hypothetical protein
MQHGFGEGDLKRQAEIAGAESLSRVRLGIIKAACRKPAKERLAGVVAGNPAQLNRIDCDDAQRKRIEIRVRRT